MRQYLIRRLLLIPVLVIGITLLDFVFINLTPGDPVTAIMNPTELVNLDPAAVEARKEALGLNKPIIVRYGIWMREMFTGNLGYSIVKSQSVATMMLNGLKNTILLMTLSLIVSTVVGITFGILSALRPHSAVDYLLTTFAFIGVGMPSFFFALILIVFGSLRLGWFPTSGIVTPGNGSLPDRLDHMVLPLIALSISGAVIIETIFAIPGIGSTLVSAMNTKDYPVIMGGVLMTGVIVLFSSLIADVAYAFADPRIRY